MLTNFIYPFFLLMVLNLTRKEESKNELKNRKVTTEAGIEMGKALNAARDNNILFEIVCGGNTYKYKPFVGVQDCISNRSKSFFRLEPDTTSALYAYVHYQALLNKNSRRGWLGHCCLFSPKLGAEGNGWVLWEIWETRCISPRLDGVVIRPEDGEVFLVSFLSPLRQLFRERWQGIFL